MAAKVTCCSRDFRYLWVSPAYADWLRRPAHEIIGRRITDVLGKEAFEELLPYFNRVLHGHKAYYERETTFHGIGRRWTSVDYTPTHGKDGSVDGWVAVVLDVTERKQAEEARFRHAAVVESSVDAIISKDLNAVITSWNEGAERIFGYAEAEVIGQPITILIPPELRDEENEILDRLRSGGRLEHYETRRVTKTGRQVDVSLTIGPIRDAKGRTVGFCKIARDITDKKRAEAALKESEARFRLVADTAPVLIWMAGTDKLCTYFNQTWLDFTGRTVEEELGNGWADRVHPDDLPTCLDTYAKSFDRREKFRMEYRLRRYDGEYRWILDMGVPRFNQDSSFAGYIGVGVDLTEQKRAQDALREMNRALEDQAQVLQAEEELLRTFVKNVPAGVAMLDREMRYLQVSERWCADYGVESPQILGRSHYEVFPDIPDRWKQVHRRALEGQTVRAEEDRWDRKQGTLWVQWEIRPWKSAAGELGGILIFAVDITRHKEMENALRDMSRKMIESQEQDRRRIGRELHDDINQRLAMLSIEIGELRDHDARSSAARKRRLTRIQEGLIEVSSGVQSISHQLHSPNLDYLGLGAAMRSFCRDFAARHNLEIHFQADKISRPIESDVSLCLFRVLQEALHNAAKYSQVHEAGVRLACERDELQLAISDKGVGFDVAEAMKSEGLGLSSMRERVRLINGEISINSRPHGGTTIYVRAPFAVAAAAD
jgi:PAS domain S-box-containing protein